MTTRGQTIHLKHRLGGASDKGAPPKCLKLLGAGFLRYAFGWFYP